MSPAHLLELARPLVYLLLAALSTYVTVLVHRRVRSRTVSTAIVALTLLAGRLVRAAYQTTVRDLKDPSQPGTWNAVAGAAVKHSVLADLRSLGATALADLMAHGFGQAQIEALLDRFIESAVADLHASTLTPAAARLDTTATATPPAGDPR